jgi:hypothetical protein
MIGSRFTCNICGVWSNFEPVGDWREAFSCEGCCSSVRARSVVHALTSRLLGASKRLADIDAKIYKGAGLSDPDSLAICLERAFDYKNTFYHQNPYLDICAPSEEWNGKLDFLVSSDVFEHVPNPVENAFDGAAKILKRGGLLVLTVPFDDREATTEHFPGVEEFKVVRFSSEWVMVGRLSDESYAVHRNLVFHGGPGSTLEMRVFSKQALIEMLSRAGFGDIKIHSEVVPEFGVFPPHEQGLPISAIRM